MIFMSTHCCNLSTVKNDGVDMREIGSEFWQQQDPIGNERINNEAYLLSGRTALRFIIDDICSNRQVKKALLPSYCCDSMILPFVQSGINVFFYQVYHDGVDYPYDSDADIVLLIDLFGYVNHQNLEIALHEKQKGKIIIYDSTHKIDGNKEVIALSNYSFCSYRKWIYCNYAKALKLDGEFSIDRELKWHMSYISLRDAAAFEKARYIAGLNSDKQLFLSKYRAAEQILDEDYIGYAGVPVVIDIEALSSRRRENATYLQKELRSIPQIKLWSEEIKNGDTPLFVPVLVDSRTRDDLRIYLINQKIYCPVHWPKSSCHGLCNELYDTELSLVCDQRYDLSDMERMARAIKDYFVDRR